MLAPNIRDREFGKFRDGQSGEVVAVTIDSGLLSGTIYDEIIVLYPDLVTEVYQYLYQSTLQAEVEITYSSSSKKDMTRARKL